jgi:hypothetical protein
MSDGEKGENQFPKYPINDFMVDFLGGLVPGSLFLVGACFALLPSFYLFFCISDQSNVRTLIGFISEVLSSTRDTPNMIWILAFALFVAVSYEIGHLYFRRDPKNPDIESFLKLKKKAKMECDKKGLNDLQYLDYLKTEYACTNVDECQFPYIYLKKYLGKRGHCHLCSFVTWSEDAENSIRSKTYINSLKIRLKHEFPQKCSIIVRNEAHVRLASSSWYVAKSFVFCSCLGIVLTVFCILVDLIFNISTKPISIYFPFFIPPIIVFLCGFYIKDKIEKFTTTMQISDPSFSCDFEK